MDEFDALKSDVADLSTEVAVLSQETREHIKDSAETANRFFDYVMDPQNGVIVRMGRIEGRVESLETWRKTKTEDRQFWFRTVLVLGLLAPILAGAVIGLVLYFAGGGK